MLITIIGVSLITVSICLILKRTNPEFSMTTALIAGIIIFMLIMLSISPVIDFITDISDKYNINSQYISIVIKALGICYITQLASDSCKDAGFVALGNKVELGGKVAVILISLPLFENILDLTKDLVSLGGG